MWDLWVSNRHVIGSHNCADQNVSLAQLQLREVCSDYCRWLLQQLPQQHHMGVSSKNEQEMLLFPKKCWIWCECSLTQQA